MNLDGLEEIADKIDVLVDRFKKLKEEKVSLLREKEELERKLNDLQRRIEYLKKEEDRVDRLLAENKANKKKIALLRAKVISMLAKLEVLQ